MRTIVVAVLVAAATAVDGNELQSQQRDVQRIGVKTLGASAGSAIGVLATLKIGRDCGAEDLGCHLRRIGVAGVASVIGASVLGYVAADALPPSVESDPSFPGLLIGSVVGAAAGAGVIKLMDEGGANPSGALALLAYSLTQGLFAALVSELPPFQRQVQPLN